MERETGIEPATSSLGSWRSTAELLPLNSLGLTAALLAENYTSRIPNLQLQDYKFNPEKALQPQPI
jgi:hypothetical protein